ncbi:MAG: single-stranded DNA-binding protein [Desulfovibrionaceae bacterium]|nr:single-stranded DNA-binding protein [Desulfovibrionaceae bacterium]
MLNKVQLIGRLGQDPQLKYTQTGSPIANFTIATDESFTDREGARQERTEWHRIVVFQKTAENCGRYLHKGSLVYVEGSLQTRKWQDQQGMDHFMTEVKAQRVVFLDKRQTPEEAAAAQANKARFATPRPMPEGGYGNEPAPEQRGPEAAPFGQDYGNEGSPFPQDAPGEAVGPSENYAPNSAPAPQTPEGTPAQGGDSSMDKLPF